jgi:hypothetical protein
LPHLAVGLSSVAKEEPNPPRNQGSRHDDISLYVRNAGNETRTATACPAYTGGVPSVGGKDAIDAAHKLHRAVADGFMAYRRSIPDGVSPEELRDNKGAYGYSDAALALQPAMDAVKTYVDAATGKITELLKGVRVADDQGSQIQAQRFWVRAERGLAAALKKGQGQCVAVAQKLVADADAAQVAVLSEELALWLSDNGIPAGWLANSLAGRVGLGDAVADANLKQKQAAVLAQNHGMLQRAFANGVDPQPILDPYSVSAAPHQNPTGA